MPNFIFIILLTAALCSCNHLLYPADRLAFIEKSSIKPEPQDIYVPLNNNDSLCTDKKSCFLHAWLFKNQAQDKKGLVIHFHGNGQNLTTHFLFFKWMTNFGYDYLVFDYRGYGLSSDPSASTEKTVQDGVAVFNYVAENFKSTPLVAIGQSLGSNILLRTLQNLNKNNQQNILPAAVVLDSSFVSYKAAASSVLSQKWFLYPLKPFAYVVISDEFSAKNEIQFTPVLPGIFFHGTDDPMIHLELGEENFKLWPGPKVMFTQQGGSHTSAFSDKRFLENRKTLLSCLDIILNKTNSIDKCF